ncbi:MAG: nucleotide exchange factor GrpE [Gordonia amarae]
MTDVDAPDQLRQLAERVEDLTRVVVRQAQTLDQLVDADRARTSGPDLPLLVELFAIYVDADACARADDAFAAISGSLERLITGRGGTIIAPSVGDPFEVSTMEAVDVRPAEGDAAPRTVAESIRPGLLVGPRSVRPAMVIVFGD